MDTTAVQTFHQVAVAHSWLTDLVVGVAQLGIVLLPAGMLAAWLIVRTPGDRQRRAILVGCVAAVVAAAIGLFLERTLNRPRPFVELGMTPLIPHAADSSFPSDHVLVGVALVGPLVWGAPRWGVWLFAWGLMVGLARVAAAVHYPSDIFGSAVLALVLDGVVWKAARPLLARLNLRRWDAGLRGSPPGARPGETGASAP